MIFNSICRIIEGTKNNDIDKVLRYSRKIISEYEDANSEDIADQLECIKEQFNPDAGMAVMDKEEEMDEFHKIAYNIACDNAVEWV